MKAASAGPVAALIGSPLAEQGELSRSLAEAGYEVKAMALPDWQSQALAHCHLVVLDLRAGFDSDATIERLRVERPEITVMTLVPEGALGLAISSMKAGAALCLSLPVRHERLQASAQGIAKNFDLKEQVERMRQDLARRGARDAIIGGSPALQRCLELSRLVADYPLNVLLTGESGTGKEAMAGLIHQSSSRSNRPFVAVDCGALAADLADDELFGHKKGAFTGAESERLGRVMEADGGTLFLDEIGNLPLELQAKLLRVLQAREVWPLGADQPVPVDLRVIAATNEDLPALVKEGKFRLDLFHRLDEFSLRTPALRERSEDVEPLALYFVSELSRRFERPIPSLPPAVMERLRAYPWPGNVRQLQNAMKHVCVMAKDVVTEADLPAELFEPVKLEVSVPAAKDGLFFSVPEGLLTLWQAQERVTKEVERRMISEALLLHRGDRAVAAESLGIHVKTFARKLREHGLAALTPA